MTIKTTFKVCQLFYSNGINIIFSFFLRYPRTNMHGRKRPYTKIYDRNTITCNTVKCGSKRPYFSRIRSYTIVYGVSNFRPGMLLFYIRHIKIVNLILFDQLIMTLSVPDVLLTMLIFVHVYQLNINHTPVKQLLFVKYSTTLLKMI